MELEEKLLKAQLALINKLDEYDLSTFGNLVFYIKK